MAASFVLVLQRAENCLAEAARLGRVVQAVGAVLQRPVALDRGIVDQRHRTAGGRLVVPEAIPAVAFGRPHQAGAGAALVEFLAVQAAVGHVHDDPLRPQPRQLRQPVFARRQAARIAGEEDVGRLVVGPVGQHGFDSGWNAERNRPQLCQPGQIGAVRPEPQRGQSRRHGVGENAPPVDRQLALEIQPAAIEQIAVASVDRRAVFEVDDRDRRQLSLPQQLRTEWPGNRSLAGQCPAGKQDPEKRGGMPGRPKIRLADDEVEAAPAMAR